MATNIFPGVYTTIVDESFTMQPLPGTIGFICLFSEKGPDNVPRMTTSVQDLINTYGVGNPAKYGQGWYIAKQYLSILGNLYVLRALPDDAGFANLGLKYDIVSGSVKSVTFEDVASVAAIGTHIETEEARRVYSCREHFIATSGQKIFNLSNIRTSNNIMLNVYRNGLYMLEGIDYTINITSKKLTFTSACNQDDVVAIYQLYYGAINILKVDTENFISINNQTTFDISDICNNNTFNIFVYRNGLYQRKNYDYIFDSNTNTIIFNNSLPGDDIIKVLCFSKLESNYGYANINIKNVFAISGQTVFDFSDICESNAIVYRNGLFQTYGLDYIINDNYIQFVNPCNADDLITIITFSELPVKSAYYTISFLNEEETKRVYSYREHFIAAEDQNVFDIVGMHITDNITLNIYRNGLYMLEGIDYTIDIINKKIIFNSACNQDDIVAIYQLYHTDKANTILRVNSKYFISINNQTIFNIASIYDNNIFNIVVYRNGIYQNESLDYIFDISTKSIVFNYPLKANDIIEVMSFVRLHPVYGYVNANTKTIYSFLNQTIFDLSDIYSSNIFDTVIYRNGLLQVYGLDYNIDDDIIQFLYPCSLNDIITITTLSEIPAKLPVDITPSFKKESVIHKQIYNIFKGKLNMQYNISDIDKDAILAEINLLNSYDMKHILLFNRDKASNSNFFNAIDNIDTIYSDTKYKLCATAIDQNNYLYFYIKCASDYSAKTAAARLFETVSWVMNKHGYAPIDNKIVYTYEYEPVLYSEQVVNDLTAYLEHAMQTRYNRMDLLDIHEALKREVGIFLESIKNTDPVIMDELQKI